MTVPTSDDEGTEAPPPAPTAPEAPPTPTDRPPGAKPARLAGTEPMTLHRSIYEQLLREIQAGTYGPGDRLPSEAALCIRFAASRITVAKAIQGLQRDGLVVRRAGSGTYVEAPEPATRYHFGLLIPELGTTEIFEPICQGIMRSPLAKSHSLLWGHSASDGDGLEHAAEDLCRQFVRQGVNGVFFAPLEYTDQKDIVNRRIVALLQQAAIPTILLDRCFEAYPRRSNLDLVGIDNSRAGFTLTQHLWQQGARRIAFVARRRSANTMVSRIAGYHFALYENNSAFHPSVRFGDAGDPAFVRSLLDELEPDGIVCGNDLTAARLMRSLIELGVRVPESVRIVGVDDVSYARFLPVPLTTIHQHCGEMGEAAMALMLNRMREPERPGLEVRIRFDLVVRNSCGAGTTPTSVA